MIGKREEILSFMKTLPVRVVPTRKSRRIRYGLNPSVFKGRGLVFYQTREYDPMRDSVYQILCYSAFDPDKIYVREAIEEKETPVILVVDLSSSMSFGVGRSSKRRILFDTAGSIGFTATKDQERVGLIGFTDRVVFFHPPKVGTGHVYHIMREVYGFLSDPRTFFGQKTDLAVAIQFLAKRLSGSSLVFVFSDFVGWEHVADLAILRSASAKHELVFVILDDPEEFNVKGGGSILMRDMEDENVIFRVPVKSLVKARKEILARRHEMMEKLRKMGIDSLELVYGDHMAKLVGFLSERRRR